MDDPNRDVILEFFRAVNEHDLDRIEGCYHEDYVSEQPCFPSRRFTGPKQVRGIYEHLYPKVSGLRYDLGATSFTQQADGSTTGFVECHMTDSLKQNNVRGVFIMVADAGKIRSGRLYMTPVQEKVGNIAQYVEMLAAPK